VKPRATLSPVSVILNTIALVLLMAVAGVVWWPIYQDEQFVIVVAAATTLGSLIAIIGAYFRWSSAVVIPVTLAVFAGFGVALAVPSKALYGFVPTLDGLLDLFATVALGWKQLLTITLPVGSYQALLVPVFVSALLCAVVALSAALRSVRGDLAVVPPVLFFLTGIAFGPREAQWPILLSLCAFAVVLLWLMWRRWYRRRAAIHALTGTSAGQALVGFRTLVTGILVMALAGGAALAATAAVPPTEQREVLRSSIEQPFDPRDYPSPLAGFRRYLQGAQANSVMFTVAGLPAGQRIRIATLDSYDGIVYSVGSASVASESGTFTRVPFKYDQSKVAGNQVSIDVTIGSYSGVWLPSVGSFEDVDFKGGRSATLRNAFYYNDTAQTAAVIGGVGSGDAYHLDAVVPLEPTEQQLRSATAGSAGLPPLTTVPAELATVLQRYIAGVDGQGARLLAMIDGLRAEGYISHGIGESEPPSRSGHSADRITQLLSDQRMIGDAEQYAVTAAIMARELGFPARVVFGFLPPQSAGNTVSVTGDMVTAWIEVNTAQYGWVTIDPNPPVREIPAEQPEEPSEVSRPQSVIQPPDEQSDLTDNQAPTETSQAEQVAVDAWVVVLLTVARIAGWVILVAGIVVSPFVVIIAAKVRRRYLRRRAASPLRRISGGWKEFEDAVLDHGYSPPPAATRTELAATVGTAQSAVVAAVADRAIFAPVEPDADEAARLWKSIDELTASLAKGKSRWERLKARISVRSLGGFRARRLFPRRRDLR
jgi:hypothetical protein